MLTLGLLAGGLLSSCSTENEPAYSNPKGSILVKAPEVVAYSGGHFWKAPATRGHDVNGNLWYQNWDTPANVTPEEIAKVLEKVKDPIYETNTIKIDWENYWVQQVYKGVASYTDGAGNSGITGSDKMDHLLAYNDNQEVWWPVHEFGGYEHINNFNHGDNQTVYTEDWNGTNPGAQYKGTTLMTGMSADGVDAQHQFGYHNSVDSKDHYEYIIVEVDGYYYVCFDFYANGTEEYPANKNMDVERDHIYNDWIVRISPAYRAGTNSDNPGGVTPKDPETPTCDVCGHPEHDGEDCDQCEEGTPCHPEEEVAGPVAPGEPEHVCKDEVEINLAVDDKNGEYLESHLSIHVRSVTNVEVFIPVPAQYYCDADDMAIVLEHAEDLMVHAGPTRTEFDINGNLVALNLEFVEGGIRIWTEGINEDVINYCRETFDDGVTFELWNYFNEFITMEELKGYLDKATVRFLDKCPDLYVNAFGYENYLEDKDCTVSIVDEQRGNYEDPETGNHLNDSPYNLLYDRKGAENN